MRSSFFRGCPLMRFQKKAKLRPGKSKSSQKLAGVQAKKENIPEIVDIVRAS